MPLQGGAQDQQGLGVVSRATPRDQQGLGTVCRGGPEDVWDFGGRLQSGPQSLDIKTAFLFNLEESPMAVRPKLMVGAGIAVAGLGLVGAGAGATFTTQVSADTSITSGGLGLSLNGETGSDVHVGVDGKRIGSHFAPISKDLLLKNTGTLDMASTFLSVTATGCAGREGAPLAQSLHVKLMDVTNDELVYDGALCSLAGSVSGHGTRSESEQGFTSPRSHADVGGQLPHQLGAGKSILYRLVITPSDRDQGLPPEAQNTRTSVKLVFTGFDY